MGDRPAREERWSEGQDGASGGPGHVRSALRISVRCDALALAPGPCPDPVGGERVLTLDRREFKG